MAGHPVGKVKCYRCGFDYDRDQIQLSCGERWICVECRCTLRLEAMKEAIDQLNRELIAARGALEEARRREHVFRCDMVCETRKRLIDFPPKGAISSAATTPAR